MDLRHAIEVFVRGFCFTKSYTSPYVPERVGDLWLMRDGEPRRTPRTWEWVACGTPATEVVRAIRELPLVRHAVSVVRSLHEADEPIREGMKAEGYRLVATEGFFVHRLKDLPGREPASTARRVADTESAARLAKAARTRQILPEHIGVVDAPLRQYAAWNGEQPIGWVRSVSVCGSTWCSNLYVERESRRRGHGRALMLEMLRDDKAHGSKGSYLLASHTGALLYPTLGYERIGELLLFAPRKPRDAP